MVYGSKQGLRVGGGIWGASVLTGSGVPALRAHSALWPCSAALEVAWQRGTACML